MAKKPVKRSAKAKAKKSGKVKNLPAKSFGTSNAASVKGGATTPITIGIASKYDVR